MKYVLQYMCTACLKQMENFERMNKNKINSYFDVSQSTSIVSVPLSEIFCIPICTEYRIVVPI